MKKLNRGIFWEIIGVIIVCALIFSFVQGWDSRSSPMSQVELEAEIQSLLNHGIDK